MGGTREGARRGAQTRRERYGSSGTRAGGTHEWAWLAPGEIETLLAVERMLGIKRKDSRAKPRNKHERASRKKD